MRPAPAIIAELTASNLTAQQLTLLLELVSVMSTAMSSGSQVESPVDALERRRKYEREYKAKRRAAAKIASTKVSTGQSTGQVDSATNSSSFLVKKEVFKKEDTTAEVVEGRKHRSARGTRLLPDTPLTEEYRNAALALKFAPDLIDGAWAEFVDYWAALPGSRGLKLNWLLTWRNRVRELLKRGRPINTKPTVHDAARNQTNRAMEFLRELDGPGTRGVRDAEGGNPLRLISKG